MRFGGGCRYNACLLLGVSSAAARRARPAFSGHVLGQVHNPQKHWHLAAKLVEFLIQEHWIVEKFSSWPAARRIWTSSIRTGDGS
jgi:hypothetical protein